MPVILTFLSYPTRIGLGLLPQSEGIAIQVLLFKVLITADNYLWQMYWVSPPS